MPSRGVYGALVVVGGLAGACSSGVSEPPSGSEIRQLLADALPEGWSVLELQEGRAPQGHGPVEGSGWLCVLLGPGSVAFRWQDASGAWHSEELARESLELWIMPGAYRPSPRRFLEHHRHVPPERVYASNRVRVYGQVSHRILDEERFNELLGVARATSWSDIAGKGCTWKGWAEALAARLGAAYG